MGVMVPMKLIFSRLAGLRCLFVPISGDRTSVPNGKDGTLPLPIHSQPDSVVLDEIGMLEVCCEPSEVVVETLQVRFLFSHAALLGSSAPFSVRSTPRAWWANFAWRYLRNAELDFLLLVSFALP